MYYTVIKHSGHLRTLEKRRKHSLAAGVFYISLVLSNTRHVLSERNTRLWILSSLNKTYKKCVLLFFATLPHKTNEEALAVYYTVIKHSGRLRTFEECKKRSSRLVFYFPRAPKCPSCFITGFLTELVD